MLFLPDRVFARDNVELEPVIITATRITSKKDGPGIPMRSQERIVVGEERVLSDFSVQAILDKSSLTDTRTRGPYGVQSDISLRGAPFEENLILLDGVGLNDPQTGHHNMDLPFTLYDVERIDVTYGPASSVYGHAGMGGAINIIPKKCEDEPHFFASSSTGSWDFYSGSASLNVPVGKFKNRSSVEWKRSTGYAPETEFNTLTASSISELDFDCARLGMILGYLTKKFGADSFYSNLYPNEEESVNTGLLIAKAEVTKDEVSIKPLFYWKRLQDKFILDRNRPFFSRNDHTTNLYGGEINSHVETPLGSVALGGGIGGEEISSTNLGNHSRTKTSAFLEYENRIFRVFLNTSMRFDYYSTFKSQFSPAVILGYEIIPGLSARGGVARAFRAPTFTDLYYSSPANKGNPDLKCENSWTYETGLDYKQNGLALSGTVFLRNTENIIDWTRKTPVSAWQAENIGEFDMFGIESSFKIDFEKFAEEIPFKNISLNYSFLEALDKKGVTSKYALEYLKHNLNLNLGIDLGFGFSEAVNLTFKKRIGNRSYFLLDSTLYKDIAIEKVKATFYIKFDNMLNTEYSEEADIEMPGFGVFGGGSVKF